jgi:cytochrome c peroxidase
MGVAFMRGGRNTPTVRYAPYTRWQFWDGRADSAWAQALGPIENPIEMASSRLRAVHALYDRYRAEYEAVFGALPGLGDGARFPPEGRPGDAAYDGMAEADRLAVDRAYANLGKAIEAYERTLRFAPSAVDRFARGDASALNASQRAGMHHFFANGCAQCHHGPMLTDDSFHNIAMPTGQLDGAADRGRIDGVAQVLASPFNAGGLFSDAMMERGHLDALRVPAGMEQLGRMHTPGLRGTGRTGPWGHGGAFARLEDVVRHYASQGLRDRVTTRAGVEDMHLGSFHSDAQTIAELASFLDAL